MSADDESSWQLLFSIALSHGKALQSKNLSREGWMVFLSSANLIGTATGVFPVLLDQLWERLARPADESPERGSADNDFSASQSFLQSFTTSITHSDAQNTSSPSCGADAAGATSSDRRVVGFGGFVDMMKVLCIRVFQAHKLASARDSHPSTDDRVGGRGEDAVLAALRHCAEDRVLLTEAVHFAASRYLRPFIAKSTIHASTRVSLRASRNGWAPHVNRLLTHVVGSLMRSTLLPVFCTFATAAGRMTEEGYHAFLKEYLPGLNTVEETCAFAIFEHGGFADIRPGLRAYVSAAAAPAAEVALLATVPTLSLTDFIDVLLMLAVVVSADEARHPELRAITAKVWHFFDRYLRRGAAMCTDPYTTGRYAAVLPGLVSVFPAVVPLQPSPTLFVEVCNATLGKGREATDANGASGDSAERKAPSAKQRETSPTDAATLFLTEVSVNSMTEAPNTAASSSHPAGVGGGDRSACVAVEVAAPLFETQWSLLERNADVPLFGDGGASSRCCVTVGGTAVDASPTACPGIWTLSLSALSLSSVQLVKCAVEATAAAYANATDEAVRLTFTPIRSLPVELAVVAEDAEEAVALERATLNKKWTKQWASARAAAADGVTPWGCVDVIFTDAAVSQVVPAPLVKELKTRRGALAAAASSTVEAPQPSSQPTCFSQSALRDLCKELQWVAAARNESEAVLSSLCGKALSTYRQYQNTLHPCVHTKPGQKASSSAHNTAEEPTMTLPELLGCLAVLCFHADAGGLRDIPDVPRRLEVSLHTVSPTQTTAATTASVLDASSKAAADLRSLPHNKLRDEPFKLALERKEVQSAASRERRAALMQALRDHHAQQLTSPVALPLLPENRPCAMRLVSQYGNVEPNEDFHRVMREGAEAIKAHFIEKELAIPEWHGN